MNHHRNIRQPDAPGKRRGSAYVAVLGASLIVAVASLAALSGIGVERKAAEGGRRFAEARLYAQSGIDLAFLWIGSGHDWRSRLVNGNWTTALPIGSGTVTVSAVDPVDGNISNSQGDPLVLSADARAGRSRFLLEVSLQPVPGRLKALQYGLCAGGGLRIEVTDSLFVDGAPASTNGDFINDNRIYGDVEAVTASKPGQVYGQLTVPAPSKKMPEADVFQQYVSLATPLPFSGTTYRQVWGPGTTPVGATNTNGVYYINTGGNNWEIGQSRIYGTLVVSCPGRTLSLKNKLLIHNYREDYPALIVDGNLEIDVNGNGAYLSEFEYGTNYNPAGASYNGSADSDKADFYPSEIQGLIHVKGDLKLKNSAWVRGTIICEGTVTVDGVNRVFYNPAISTNPPLGYMDPVANMAVVQDSWRKVVMP